jgi:hypothetical protein
MNPIRKVAATRYVTPLREGGSLPAIVEADDDGLYVLKFHGAGQGPRTLIAELVAGEIGRGLGLPVPEIVLIELDPVLGNAEPDPEIQDLIKKSGGLNLGLDFLPGSLAFAPAAPPSISPELAAAVVWFDAFVMNVDRTPRNPNIAVWHGEPWLIDHGAALYVHFNWDNAERSASSRFPQVGDHILLPFAGPIPGTGERLRDLLAGGMIEGIVAMIPAEWTGEESVEAARRRYVTFLEARLAAASTFEEEAERARTQRV